MLTLSREVGERIIIGDDIVIEVRAIVDGRVRIAIEAPRQVPIHRAEHFDAVSKANLAAASTETSNSLVEALGRADLSAEHALSLAGELAPREPTESG